LRENAKFRFAKIVQTFTFSRPLCFPENFRKNIRVLAIIFAKKSEPRLCENKNFVSELNGCQGWYWEILAHSPTWIPGSHREESRSRQHIPAQDSARCKSG
jgi:hypothetical protein